MSSMSSFIGVLDLKTAVDRVNKEVESVLSNVRRINREASPDAIQEAIIDTDQFLRSHPAAGEMLHLLADSLLRLNFKLEINLVGQPNDICNTLIDRNASITSGRGSLFNQACLCETNSKGNNTKSINTNVESIYKMYGIEIESILEMQLVQGDRPSQFCLSYYSKTALQNHLAAIEQKVHAGELHQTSVTPAIGEFIIGFVGNIFRGSVLSVNCGKIVAFDIDTGALKKLNEYDSWEMGDSLSQLPPQAIQCKLWSILDNVEWCEYLSRIFQYCVSRCNLVVTIKGVIPGTIPTFVVDIDAHDMNELVDFNMSQWIMAYVLPTTEKIKLLGLSGVAKDVMLEDTDPYKLYREDSSNSDSFVSTSKYDADISHDVDGNSISDAISNCIVENGEKLPVRDLRELIFSSSDDYLGQLDRNDVSNSINIEEITEDSSNNSLNDMNLSQDTVELNCQKCYEFGFDSSKSSSNSAPQTVKPVGVKCFLKKGTVWGMSFLKGEDPWNFILHYVRKQEIARLKRKISAKATAGALVPFLNRPGVGDFAIGKYGNEFYRVQVMDVFMENIQVFDVDSGETMFLYQDNLWVLEIAFSLLPALAVPCTVWNITRKRFYWNSDLQELFKKVMTAGPLSVEVKEIQNIAGSLRHIVEIKVLCAIEINISKWIVLHVFPRLNEIKLISDNGHSIDNLNLDPTKMFSEDPISKRYCKDEILEFTKPSYEVKCGTKYYVFMSNILSPSEFYVHIVSKEFSLIAQMVEELEKYCLSSSISYWKKSEASQLIQQCCAVFYIDMWCRGRIIDWLNNSTDDVQVFLVDYGIHATVSFHHIQPLRSDFYELPIIAQRCSLARILPPGTHEKWPQQSIDGFSSVLDYNTVYEMYIDSYIESEETFNVFLTTSVDKDRKSVNGINDYMVDEGLAAKENVQNECETMFYGKRQ